MSLYVTYLHRFPPVVTEGPSLLEEFCYPFLCYPLDFCASLEKGLSLLGRLNLKLLVD